MHKCYLPGCVREVEPKYLLCRQHWARVPFQLKKNVWATYKRGQEITKTPTTEYVAAAKAAIEAVAAMAGR